MAMHRALMVLLAAAVADAMLPGRCKDLVIGSHHKSGTVLALHLFETICQSDIQYLNRTSSERCRHDRTCLYDHFRPEIATSLGGGPLVHFVRDPLDWFVSGYQYHLFTDEPWAKEFGYQQKLRNMTEEEGLAAEIQQSMQDVTEAAVVYNLTRHRPDTVTVRLEEMEDYDTFQRVTSEIQQWLGVGAVDVSMHFKGKAEGHKDQKGSEHVHITNKADKPRLRNILMKNHGRIICRLRTLLGKSCD
eukprot:TRINITY_DN5988_c0_g1_i1.p1 TRINITY_DN5988_c0_g1~~TRINITY_DN5988_c0_g1_i1.p1  ORF type:complete len:246 (+),score=61.17 TRINITY_DN5988_c0_g1_i1:56-793(+)